MTVRSKNVSEVSLTISVSIITADKGQGYALNITASIKYIGAYMINTDRNCCGPNICTIIKRACGNSHGVIPQRNGSNVILLTVNRPLIHVGQAILPADKSCTAYKGIMTDPYNAFGNFKACKACTIIESIFMNSGNTTGNLNSAQGRATSKDVIINRFNTVA